MITITDLMTWGKALGLRPRDVLVMVDRKNPEWDTAIDALYISAEIKNFGRYDGDRASVQAILPVASGFGGKSGGMAKELLESIGERGVEWRVEIRRYRKAAGCEWDSQRMGFSYVIGAERFWRHAGEIEAVMNRSIKIDPPAHFLSVDFSDIDKLNGRTPNRGKVMRPNSHEIARRAALALEDKHPGSVKSFQRWEGPWQLLALRVGYRMLAKLYPEKMEGNYDAT